VSPRREGEKQHEIKLETDSEMQGERMVFLPLLHWAGLHCQERGLGFSQRTLGGSANKPGIVFPSPPEEGRIWTGEGMGAQSLSVVKHHLLALRALLSAHWHSPAVQPASSRSQPAFSFALHE
jgi:hypothetical protein